MCKRQAKRVRRELSREEEVRWERAQRETESEKEEILAERRRVKFSQKRAEVAVRDALKMLKAERLGQGLSLSDIEKHSGIGRAALSRLENEDEANPTVATLTRYAEALGKTLVVGLE